MCWVLGEMLKKVIEKMLRKKDDQEQQPQQQIQLQHQQQQQQHQQQHHQQILENNTEKRLKRIGEFILWGKGERKVLKGYKNHFLPLWENHHHPCKRGEKKEEERGEKRERRETCSMKEPTIVESFLYFRDILGAFRGEIERELVEGSRMKGWGLELEVVRELVEWMEDEGNVVGFISYFSGEE